MKYIYYLYKFLLLSTRRLMDYIYPQIYKNMPGLEMGKNVRFWGKPIIDIRYNGKILIGDNSQIISTNIGTHVNYSAPAKLFVDRPGARIIIEKNCTIGGACIHSYKLISIGENTLIGQGSQIIDANGHPVSLNLNNNNRRVNIDDSQPIHIGKNVWITLNCIVLPGAIIGDGTIIGPNSVVRGEIPSNVIAAGNPAIIVHHFEHDNIEI